jgi:hypothetical protein
VLGDEAKELPEAKRLTFPVNCSSEQVYSMLSQPIPIASRGMPAGHLIAVGPHQLHPSTNADISRCAIIAENSGEMTFLSKVRAFPPEHPFTPVYQQIILVPFPRGAQLKRTQQASSDNILEEALDWSRLAYLNVPTKEAGDKETLYPTLKNCCHRTIPPLPWGTTSQLLYLAYFERPHEDGLSPPSH